MITANTFGSLQPHCWKIEIQINTVCKQKHILLVAALLESKDIQIQ